MQTRYSLTLGLAVAALTFGCTTDGDSSPVNSGANTAEPSEVPEVAEIPTQEAAIEEAMSTIDDSNADAVFDALTAEIEAELADQP